MRLRDAMERVVRGELAPPPVATLLGISLASFKDGEAVVTLAAGDSHTNPMGTVQGGVLAALADGAKGWAYRATRGLVECDVADAEGNLAAYAVSTQMTLRGAQAAGR